MIAVKYLTGLVTIFPLNNHGIPTTTMSQMSLQNNFILTIRLCFYTYIGWFELVDDGGFAAVIEPQTQNVDFFLPQAQPAREFIQQPH